MESDTEWPSGAEDAPYGKVASGGQGFTLDWTKLFEKSLDQKLLHVYYGCEACAGRSVLGGKLQATLKNTTS